MFTAPQVLSEECADKTKSEAQSEDIIKPRGKVDFHVSDVM